jgi:hydroxymethylglutaryl-CoA lyase
LITSVSLREVGPRDGLQPEAPLVINDRLRLIEALVAAGCRSIEATAFVSPRAVPAMSGAAVVASGVRGIEGVEWWALVPNVRGAVMAVDAGLSRLTVTVSASEEYSRRNVGMSTDESVAQVPAIVDVAPVVDVVISCAFGSPYEGLIPVGLVADLVARCRLVGASVTLADTTGVATPTSVAAVLEAVGLEGVGLHLHDSRGTALVNAYAALLLGVSRFDTAVGGLGGSPFAKGAGGNLATEDFVYLCDSLGVATGVSLDGVLEASALVATLVGRPVPSRLAAALAVSESDG